jgi:hypothetical protein
MNPFKLLEQLHKATIYRAKLHQATIRLAKQLNWVIDPELDAEQQTLDLLKQLSAKIAIASFTPLPKPKPNMGCLDLTKHPLRQPPQPAFILPPSPKKPMLLLTEHSNSAKNISTGNLN